MISCLKDLISPFGKDSSALVLKCPQQRPLRRKNIYHSPEQLPHALKNEKVWQLNLNKHARILRIFDLNSPHQAHIAGVNNRMSILLRLSSKDQSKSSPKFLLQILHKLNLRRSPDSIGFKKYILQLQAIRHRRSIELLEALRCVIMSNQHSGDGSPNCTIELEIENVLNADVFYRAVCSQINWICNLETKSVKNVSLKSCNLPGNYGDELSWLLTLYKKKSESNSGRSNAAAFGDINYTLSLQASFENYLFLNGEAADSLQELCERVQGFIDSDGNLDNALIRELFTETKSQLILILNQKCCIHTDLQKTLQMLVEYSVHSRIGFACYLPQSLSTQINRKNEEWNAKKELFGNRRLPLNQLGLQDNVYGIMKEKNSDDSSFFPESVKLFSSLPEDFPCNILRHLLSAIRVVHEEVGELLGTNSCNLTLDSLLPILIDIINRSSLGNVFSKIHLVERFGGQLTAEEEYYLTCIISAVTYIMEYE